MISNPLSFFNEACHQERCAGCGSKTKPFQAHHVIYRQELRRRGLPEWDTRGARRVCEGPLECHVNHHSPNGPKIKTKRLTDENIEYAFESLGAYAYDYLRARYDDSDPDPRLVERLAATEAIAA